MLRTVEHGPARLELFFLENRELQSLIDILDKTPRKEIVPIKVSGRVSLYNNDNYLLLTNSFVKFESYIEVEQNK